MDHLEEEFKKRFTDAHSKAGVDEDKLWADISAALPESKPRARFWFILALLLSVGLAMFTVIWFYFGDQDSPQKNTSASTVQSIESPGDKKIQEQLELKVPINTPAVKDINESESLAVSGLQKAGEFIDPQTAPRVNIEPQFETLAKEPELEKTSIKIAQNIDLQENKTDFQLNSPTENREGDLPPIMIERQETTPLPLFPLSKINYGRAEHFPELKKTQLPEVASSMLPKKQRAKNWEIGLMGGTNYFLLNFKENKEVPGYEPVLENSHHPETGYQISGEIHWRPTQNLRFGAGLGYISTYSRFNFVKEWDTLVQRNNGQNIELIKARATRTVEHHNQHDFLSLPLTIGFGKKLGKFATGVDVGIGLNYFFARSGKSLNAEGDIQEVEGQKSENQAYSKFAFSAIINPYIEFWPSQHYSIRFQPSLRMQQHSVSELYGLKANSILWGLNLGVFRRF